MRAGQKISNLISLIRSRFFMINSVYTKLKIENFNRHSA